MQHWLAGFDPAIDFEDDQVHLVVRKLAADLVSTRSITRTISVLVASDTTMIKASQVVCRPAPARALST
ncbi:hypothetical protein X755_15605 [Mesorhizobium sp. LNJC405B00]|nr:hypothetical protein X755_15605 [Mesorhizobium sp. LNJC405B00]